KSLSESFGNLENLTRLYLQYNQIEELPRSFYTLSNLQIVNLANNKLKFLPEDMSQLENLTTLEIQVNELTAIPDSFEDLTNLKVLNLRNEQLASYPAVRKLKKQGCKVL
ncbi:MAG: leucine-rich repeat domain-containing protein, partial [Candidatus Hermodarchaeota archaeon]